MQLTTLLQRLRLLKPYSDIHINGDLYMRRFWIKGDEHQRAAGKKTIGVHHILRPDADRDFHTHPCAFISMVWRGWYLERLPRSQTQDPSLDQTEYVEKLRLPFSIAYRRASDRHAIVSVSKGGVWTLVLWLRKEGTWGFKTPAGFIPWREYHAKNRLPPKPAEASE